MQPAESAPEPAPRSGRLATGAYLAVVFLFWMGMYIYVPTLAPFVQSRTGSLAVVGVVLSMYGLWQGVVRLPLGIVTDWLGRQKPFIMAGIALAGAGAWIMAGSSTVFGLAAGRAVTGLAAGAWVPMLIAFSALFPAKDSVRASALLTFCNSLGCIVASFLTGFLNDRGGYALAFYAAVGICAAALLVMAFIPERRRPSFRPSLKGVGRLVLRRDVLLPSGLSAVVQWMSQAISFGFLPVLAAKMGASSVLIGLMATVYLAMNAAGSLLATFVTERNGVRWQLCAWFALLAAGMGGAALSPSIGWLVAAQAVMGLAKGVCYPALMGLSIRHVSEEERNTAMGLHQSVYAVGMFAGPALSGALAAAIGLQPMFGLTAAACLALGVTGSLFLADRESEKGDRGRVGSSAGSLRE
jgi:MFS family permease